MDDLDLFSRSWEYLKNENLHFLLVSTITQQILVALALNLYQECISGVSWLSLKMDELYLYFEVIGIDFTIKM